MIFIFSCLKIFHFCHFFAISGRITYSYFDIYDMISSIIIISGSLGLQQFSAKHSGGTSLINQHKKHHDENNLALLSLRIFMTQHRRNLARGEK
jgi:hypothetical protein